MRVLISTLIAIFLLSSNCASKKQKDIRPSWTAERKAYLNTFSADLSPTWRALRNDRPAKQLRSFLLPLFEKAQVLPSLQDESETLQTEFSYLKDDRLIWCWLPKFVGVSARSILVAPKETEFVAHVFFEHALTLPESYGDSIHVWLSGPKQLETLKQFLIRPTRDLRPAIERTISWLYLLNYDPRGLSRFFQQYPERFSALDLEAVNFSLRKYPPPREPIVSTVEYERLKKEVASWAKNSEPR